MAFDESEEFFGTGRTVANLRRGAWFGLTLELGFGLLFVTMWWWMAPGDALAGLHPVYRLGVLLSPLIGLYFLYRFVRDIAGFLRADLGQDGELLWYVLDSKGLHIKHDLGRIAAAHITASDTGPTHVIEWSAMKSIAVTRGAVPSVRIVRRLPGAIIDRAIALVAGQRSRSGAVFEDRLEQWFAAKASAAQPMPMMTGALPAPREALRQPGDA